MQDGRKVLLLGDVGYLARMHVHDALGIESPATPERDERGRFLPVRLVDSLEEIGPVVEAVSEIFARVLRDREVAWASAQSRISGDTESLPRPWRNPCPMS